MINHSKEISQVRPEVPKELRIALSGVHWERLIDQSMSNERTTLIAVDEKSDVLPTERVSGDRIITLPSSVLLASGAKISPDLEGGGWIIDNFDPQILTRESSGGLLTHSAFSSSSQFGSLLPAALRPDWLIEYPALVSEIAKRPLDQLSGWMRLRGHELVERFEGLRERYPERALVPLFARAAGEDLLCLERGNGDILVQVHDFAEPGFEGSAKVGPVHSWWEGMEQKLAEQYQRALSRIVQDERYAQGLGWGKARKGHPEGTVAAHIEELEKNVEAIAAELSPLELAKLQVFVHTHDTFKGIARKGAKIEDPESHASLARRFVEEVLGETALSPVIQYHDELYALWRLEQREGKLDGERYNRLVNAVEDWDTFITTKLVDNITVGKSLEPTEWALRLIEGDDRIELSFDPWARMNKILESRGFQSSAKS